MTIVSPVVEYNIRRHLRLNNPKSALWIVDLLLSNHNNPEHTKFSPEYGTYCVDPLLAGQIFLLNEELGRAETFLFEALRIHKDNEYQIPKHQFTTILSPNPETLDGDTESNSAHYTDVLAIHPKCAQCSTMMFMSEIELPLSTAICPVCHELGDVDTHPRLIQIVSALIKCFMEQGQPEKAISLLEQHGIPYEALPYSTLTILFTIYTSLHNSSKLLDIAYRMLCLLPDNLELLFQLAQQLNFNALVATAGDANIIPLFLQYISSLSAEHQFLSHEFDSLKDKLSSVQTQIAAATSHPKHQHQHQQQQQQKRVDQDQIHRLEAQRDDLQVQLNPTTVLDRQIEVYQQFFHDQFVIPADFAASDPSDLLNTSSLSKQSKQSRTSIISTSSTSLTPTIQKMPFKSISMSGNAAAKRKSSQLNPTADDYYAETDKENNLHSANTNDHPSKAPRTSTKRSKHTDTDLTAKTSIANPLHNHHNSHASSSAKLTSTTTTRHSIQTSTTTTTTPDSHDFNQSLSGSTLVSISDPSRPNNHALVAAVKKLYHNYATQSHHYFTSLFTPLAQLTSQIAQYQYLAAHSALKTLERSTVMGINARQDAQQPDLLQTHAYSLHSNSHTYAHINAIISINVRETHATCALLQQASTQNQFQVLGMDLYAFFLARLQKKPQLNALYLSLRTAAPNRPETAIAKVCLAVLDTKLDLALQLITHLLLQPQNQFYQFGHFLKAHILSLLLRPEAIDVLQYASRVGGTNVHLESTICNLFAANRELSSAINRAHALFEKSKNNPKVLTLLGSLLLQGAVDSWRLRGVQVLNTALVFDPTSWLATSLLATYNQTQGDIHQAIDIVEKYLNNLAPNMPAPLLNPQAHFTLGKLYLLVSNAEGAAKAFYTALKIDKDFAPAKIELTTSFISAVSPSAYPPLGAQLDEEYDEDYEMS